MNEQATQEQVEMTQTTVENTKAKKSGDFFMDVAQEIESLTKVKALNLANTLAENIESNYFRLGGVLTIIYQNSWFEGHESFASFVSDRFGFQERKAKYLMEIYQHLVNNSIPWEKVAHLGWTKLKDLARYLTVDNVDEWVAKAENITVTELQNMLKASEGVEGTVDTVSDVTTIKFKLKQDQVETVQSALNKAKAECSTEYDSVALEMICTGYLGGSVSSPTKLSLEEVIKSYDWLSVLQTFGVVYPQINVTAKVDE